MLEGNDAKEAGTVSSRQNKTPISEIVDYWAPRIDECDLSVDWSEAEEYCWNCGSPKDLTRCHIVARSLGGQDIPSNYVVLCRKCHEEAPNVEDPRIMWDWLIAHKASFYKTHFVVEGRREYAFIYKRTVDEEIRFIMNESNSLNEDRFQEIFKESISRSTTHWGQYTPNKATIAGTIRMALLQYAEECGVTLPDARAKTLTPKEYLT